MSHSRKYGDFKEYAGTIRTIAYDCDPEEDVLDSYAQRYACFECLRVYPSWKQAAGCTCKSGESLDQLDEENILDDHLDELREKTNKKISEVEKDIEELKQRDLSEGQREELERLENKLDSQKNTMEIINQANEEGDME